MRTARRTTWRAARLGVAAVAAGALVAGAGAAGARAAPAASGGQRAGLLVSTAGGMLRGKAADQADEFLGIPYAAPPVGPLRWRPLRPAARWPGVRDATAYAPHCPQPPSPFGVASTSENCLYLNVFSRPPREAVPGRSWCGSTAVPSSPGRATTTTRPLVRHGVIVVTINYRLGALGFLADSSLAGHPGGPSGNYGLMDQQAALRWVQRNIAGFGGDPRNVTLAGESAGGLSVLSQLASPGARGLFSRAIAESGTYDLTQVKLGTAEAAGLAFAAKAGCTGNTAACLRALPVSAVVDNEDFTGYRPDIDGQVLTQSVGPALASGQFSRVPVIIGTNHDEWRLFVAQAQLDGGPAVTAANYPAQIAATLSVSAAAATAIASEYPLASYPSPAVALGAVGTDEIFACPALTADQSLSKYVPAYAYEFSDENAPERYLPPVGFPYGAAHESELQYLFTLRNTAFPARLTPSQQHLAAAMKAYWTDFAASGYPATAARPIWPRFSSAGEQMLSLAAPRPSVETTFAAEHHCGFWAGAG